MHLALPISPWEAALGATVEVPTLGGDVELKIPAGSNSGKRMRLRGRGMPGRTPGDQFVTLEIHAPPAETDAQRKLYETDVEELRLESAPRNCLRTSIRRPATVCRSLSASSPSFTGLVT